MTIYMHHNFHHEMWGNTLEFLTMFSQSSHIHLIDALMMAYTAEMISIEKVVTCVKRFSNFSASKELRFDLEDAMVFWINKVRGMWWSLDLFIPSSLFTDDFFFHDRWIQRWERSQRKSWKWTTTCWNHPVIRRYCKHCVSLASLPLD